MLSTQILLRKQSRAGIITLTRPAALNAITFDMCMAIKAATDVWKDDPDIDLVIIEGEGERAFSAGGDVDEIYRAGISGDIEFSRSLWRNEYPFLASLSDYPKPYVALMDGFVMGLGAGVSMHGSHRIVTERTRFAMPECVIGHLPDTGVSALFAKAPGRLGYFLGMTGARLGPADTIYAGLADSFVPSFRIEALKEQLIESGDVSHIEVFTERAPVGDVIARQGQIDTYFSHEDPVEIIQALEASNGEWEAAQAKAIRAASPISIACFLRVLDEVSKNPTVANAVTWEFRYAYRSLSEGDFLEGVRAQIVDKDRSPKWRLPTLEDVSDDVIDTLVAFLDHEELLI